MDPIHKKVLAHKTSVIMKRISSPTTLSAHLKTIFSTVDLEEIETKTTQRGATTGTQTLLSLLEKRGPNAYSLFLKALRDPDINQEDLADELEQEDGKLRGKAGELKVHKETDQILQATTTVTLSGCFKGLKLLVQPLNTHAKHGSCKSYKNTALGKRNKLTISKEKTNRMIRWAYRLFVISFLIRNKGPGDFYRKGIYFLAVERFRYSSEWGTSSSRSKYKKGP